MRVRNWQWLDAAIDNTLAMASGDGDADAVKSRAGGSVQQAGKQRVFIREARTAGPDGRPSMMS